MFSLPYLFSGGHPENILILLLLHTLVFACDLPYPVILVRVVDRDTAYMSVTIRPGMT
jgi:hypothetical protein